MVALSVWDYVVIGSFFAVILAVGLAMARRASKNLESYFLGGRKLPWYLLGICGMSSWFDLTGTMIITSFLYMLGTRGLYIEFRGGAVLILAFMLAYTAKWHRRSGCMTPAEWTTYRFGTGFSGEMLRLVSAIMGIVITIGLLSYLVRGATLFMGMIFPVNPLILTIGILGFSAIYTVLAGFYGVVLTDLVQGVIMIAGCLVLSCIAWNEVPNAEALAATAQQVTGNANWISSVPSWHTTMPKGYEAYESIVFVALFYLLRNILGGLGTGAESRFFAARNSREASLQCMMQGLTVMFRWPLMMAFAIMGIFLVARMLPNASTTEQASALIHQAQPQIADSDWHSYTSQIVHYPETAPAGLVDHLKETLGPDWQGKLLLIGPNGTVNPEVILPAVLLNSLAPGVRGLLIVCLLAALMGMLTGNVNSASALFVRDIYQNFLRPKAHNWELILGAHLSSIAIIVISFLLGLGAKSINDLWSWFIMGLTAGTLGPGMLRLYWWRTNAAGMAAGIFSGGIAAIIQRLVDPGMPEWEQLLLMSGISIVATVVGSLATAPTPEGTLRHFYHTTRPFGWWKPYWSELPADKKASWGKEHRSDMLAVCFTLVWQVCLFLLPMQVLTHNWEAFAFTLPIFLGCCVGLYFFWWLNLPPADEQEADAAYLGASPVAATGDPMPSPAEAP